MANLVIVESPSKAATIKGYLGSNYKVIASKGHVRDLPKSTLGVDLENDFAPHYINIRGRGDVITQLKKEAKAANKVFLATDPDREGEAISWHLATVLGIPFDKACRVTFNEITKGAVKDAIKHPRVIDEDLVNSQQARRILDRIVGYKLSPFLWKNVKSGLSAGRVQSVATRIIVERDEEIRAFVPKEYWTVDALLQTASGEEFTARYVGKRKLESEADAAALLADLQKNGFTVVNMKSAEKKKQPAPPFTTSTMQQEASRKLGFQSQRIMKVAQELYEGINLGSEFGGVQGLITYMRTDSLRISNVAQEAALDLIRTRYGEEYMPPSPRVYRAKSNAQDAHEAIRPSNVAIEPKQIKKLLTSDQYKLYKLIWDRFVASQMAAAVLNTTTIEIENGKEAFRASGYTVKFQGYMSVYGNDDHQDEDGSYGRLPMTEVGEKLTTMEVTPSQHFTEPPAHYNEATLIKFLEENGIGRPSTYTPIITTIIARSYVKRSGKALVSTPLGEVTTRLMKENFPDIVNYEFTASMEDKLDSIENKTNTMNAVLGDFYDGFKVSLEKAMSQTTKETVEIPPEESNVECELCGRKMVYKNGRFGRFLACPRYPECKNTKAIDRNGNPVTKNEEKNEIADFKCELCGGDMILRTGRYGSFYACANYPTCKNTKQKVIEIGVPCPQCGAKIVAKRGKGRTSFYSCERYPECDFSSWDMPTNEQCPQCGKQLFLRKSRNTVLCHDKQCGYKREEPAVTKQEEETEE
ncbi:MAG: type I DNA topoisomerase [Clostridia bacterium]|nr:type I DNA topoisomerase [Clostridia bacterium]